MRPQLIIECLPYVNQTDVDNLTGIIERYNLPNKPQPELLSLFQKHAELSMEEIKMKLIKIKNEVKEETFIKFFFSNFFYFKKPYSVSVYHKIANYFRILGNSLQAIECFRKALYLDPANADILLGIAHLFHHIGYIDDSIELIRKSLSYIKPGEVAYEQHNILAQILIAYDNIPETSLNVHYSLKLQPDFKASHDLIAAIEKKIAKSDYPNRVTIIVLGLIVSFAVILIIILIVENYKQYRSEVIKESETKNSEEEKVITGKKVKNSQNGSDSDCGDHQNKNPMAKILCKRKSHSNCVHSIKHSKSKRSI